MITTYTGENMSDIPTPLHDWHKATAGRVEKVKKPGEFRQQAVWFRSLTMLAASQIINVAAGRSDHDYLAIFVNKEGRYFVGANAYEVSGEYFPTLRPFKTLKAAQAAYKDYVKQVAYGYPYVVACEYTRPQTFSETLASIAASSPQPAFTI